MYISRQDPEKKAMTLRASSVWRGGARSSSLRVANEEQLDHLLAPGIHVRVAGGLKCDARHSRLGAGAAREQCVGTAATQFEWPRPYQKVQGRTPTRLAGT